MKMSGLLVSQNITALIINHSTILTYHSAVVLFKKIASEPSNDAAFEMSLTKPIFPGIVSLCRPRCFRQNHHRPDFLAFRRDYS
jgi:hypothetical protein